MFINLLRQRTSSEVSYDRIYHNINPAYPKHGQVRWREIGLTVPNAQHLRGAHLHKTGLCYGTHAMSVMKINNYSNIIIIKVVIESVRG